MVSWNRIIKMHKEHFKTLNQSKRNCRRRGFAHSAKKFFEQAKIALFNYRECLKVAANNPD